jgi:hypothetical protein
LLDHTHDEFEVKQPVNKEEMEPHIDQNYHYDLAHHRRLNLIIYMNKGWSLEFGGNLELHSNPKDWFNNEVITYPANFNCAIIFETNEQSWHGYSQINIPDSHPEPSRKSLAHYFYTKDRPVDEIAIRHTTNWIGRRPNYDLLKEGVIVTRELIEHVEKLLVRGYGRSDILPRKQSS